MSSNTFPLVTLGAFGLGSTWAAIPPSLGRYEINAGAQIGVAILGTLYLGLDVASYIPVARQISGIIRIAITIIAGFIILPQCKGDYVQSATTMLIAQIARGIFETFVPLPVGLYDTTKAVWVLYFLGAVALETTAFGLNLARIASTILKFGTVH